MILLTLLLLILVYIFFIRPRHLRWGAYDSELKFKYPGDNIVQKPDFDAIRVITINTKPSDVWKWIIQIGSKRAGWYSIDWIDNGGKSSSDKILPEFQEIFIGQFIPFTTNQKHGLWVMDFKENEYILWTDKEGKSSWIWYFFPYQQNGTRLVSKLRTKYVWKSFWIVYYLLYDVGDFIMMSKCLKGIKKRAELNNI